MARELITRSVRAEPFDKLRANGKNIAFWLTLSSLLFLCACSTPTVIGGDVFEMHRNAVLAYESGNNARAEALYQGLARAAPNDPEIWLRLGNLYARANKPDDAADAYQHSLLLNPRDARVWYNLGVIRQRQALAAFIQANQLSAEGDAIYRNSAARVKAMTADPTTADADTETDASQR